MVKLGSGASKTPENNSRKDGDFRPQRLLPPTLASDEVSYAAYISAYRLYLESLSVFKTRFWDAVSRKVVRSGEFKTLQHVTIASAKGPKVSCTTFERDGVFYRTSDGEVVDGKLVPKSGASALSVPDTSSFSSTSISFVQASEIPFSEPRGEQFGKSIKVMSEETKKARRRAKNFRKKMNRLKKANNLAAQVGKLDAANKNIKSMEAVEGGWTVVTRKAKITRKVPSKKGKKVEKSKTVNDKEKSEKPSGSGPNTSAKKGKGPAKETSKSQSRRERRRAIYGPPKSEVRPFGERGEDSSGPFRNDDLEAASRILELHAKGRDADIPVGTSFEAMQEAREARQLRAFEARAAAARIQAEEMADLNYF